MLVSITMNEETMNVGGVGGGRRGSDLDTVLMSKVLKKKKKIKVTKRTGTCDLEHHLK